MTSSFSHLQLYVRVLANAVERHRFKTDNRVIFGQHYQGLNIQSLNLLVCNSVFIKNLLGRGVFEDPGSQVCMKLHQILWGLYLFHVNETTFLPKVHQRVSANRLLDVPLDEEALINAAHLFDSLSYVKRRGQGHEGFDLLQRFRSQEVAHEVVTSKGSADHIDFRVRMATGDCF